MIRVLIVEERRAIAEVIAAVLRGQSDIQVAGCATNLIEASSHLEACDAVLVSGAFQADAGPRLVRDLWHISPRVKVIVMGLDGHQSELLAYLHAGASGCVPKECSLTDLLNSIRAASREAAPALPPLSAPLLPYLAELTRRGEFAEAGDPESLTRREREVLLLVQRGLTNQEIARTLVIELGTVKNHVHNILRKLNVNSRRDAAHLSRLAGWARAPSGAAYPRPEPMRSREPAWYSQPLRAAPTLVPEEA